MSHKTPLASSPILGRRGGKFLPSAAPARQEQMVYIASTVCRARESGVRSILVLMNRFASPNLAT
jgi:hypothetical protein